MRNIAALFSFLDKQVQKPVDALAFFCMRHFGMTRARVRYFGCAILICVVGASAMGRWGKMQVDERVIAAFVIGLLLLYQHLAYRHESHIRFGAKTLVDELFSRITIPGKLVRILIWTIFPWKTIQTALVLKGVLPQPIHPVTGLSILSSVIGTAAFVIIIYVSDTPDEPPVKHTANETAEQAA